MDIRPVFFPDVEMVRMLFGKSLKPFHKVRKRAKKRFFLNCYFADRFRNESCGNDIDEVAVIDFPTSIVVRFACSSIRIAPWGERGI